MTLTDVASAYQELMKYQYRFLLGHKGKTETMVISSKQVVFSISYICRKSLFKAIFYVD